MIIIRDQAYIKLTVSCVILSGQKLELRGDKADQVVRFVEASGAGHRSRHFVLAVEGETFERFQLRLTRAHHA